MLEPVLGSWLLTLLALCLIYALVKYKQSEFTRQGIPHHRSWFFYLKIGRQAHVVDETNLIYRKYCRSGKPFAGFHLFLQPIIVALDLDVIRDILIRDFNNLSHRCLYYNPRDDPLMGNCVVVDGPQWKKLRAKITPSFTAAKVKYMFPTVVAVGERLEHIVGGMIATNSIVDVKELAACYTTDVVASITLGLDSNSLANPNADFRVMMRELFDSYDIFKDMLQQTFPGIARKLGCIITPKRVTKFFMETVRSTIEYRQRENIKRADFLQIMMELYAGQSQKETWTFEEIAGQVFIFILAGFETSATTIMFCLYELSLNLAAQEKLREEVQQVLRDNDGKLTFENIKDMIYLEQVVLETLRMHPSAPALKRVAVTDYQLPGTKYHIKAGTNIIIPMEAIHYDERYYPSPEKFEPTRFAPDLVKERHPMTYLPFGDGPRNCIGQRFGLLQTMSGIAMLVKDFRFSLAPSTPVPMVYDNRILLRAPRDALELQVERIV